MNMQNTDKEFRYFLYCRKSSEDKQRQIASIDDQVHALMQIVEREQLTLLGKPLKEEKSAKDPKRPVFDEMIERIKNGEANGIICWDIDRLTRNPIDGGTLAWMLQKGVIRAIKTPSRTYYPEDAGLLLSIEQGRATDFVIRLSKNVKRGLNGKASRGWRPSAGPIGYINVGVEKGSKTIANDPQRFELVRKMWDLFLTGTYSVSTIRDIATNDWGLRTLQRKKIGGKPLSMSHMYKIFGDSFYYGYFPWKDLDTGEEKMIKGNHQPMITEAEYWRAQTLLGKKGKPRAQTREFAFTGLITCGECNGSVTAEEKHQLICSECRFKFAYENKHACPKCLTPIGEMKKPTILHYTYYHCVKKPRRDCTQGSIRLQDLEAQFKEELQKITVDQEYLNLALDYLKDRQSSFGKEETAMRGSLEAAYESCQTRLKNLHAAYISPQNSKQELYTSEEFAKQKAEITAERDELKKQLSLVEETLDKSLLATVRTFNFCAFALHHFNTGDLRKKRAIFGTIGSNLVLKDKKLTIDKLHPFLLIENELRAQKQLQGGIEPKKSRATKGKEAAFATSSPDWLRG